MPTVPISGPNFDGSGTGVIYCSSQAFPKRYQGVYFVNMATNATQWERPPGTVMLWGEGPHRPAPMRKGASMR